MKPMNLRKLKAKAMVMAPSVVIGKSGLTEGIVNEIKVQIKKKRTIKVKMLRSFIAGKDKKEVVSEILHRTDAKLVQKVGFVVTLTKK
jgi:RNA-binding protein